MSAITRKKRGRRETRKLNKLLPQRHPDYLLHIKNNELLARAAGYFDLAVKFQDFAMGLEKDPHYVPHNFGHMAYQGNPII